MRHRIMARHFILAWTVVGLSIAPAARAQAPAPKLPAPETGAQSLCAEAYVDETAMAWASFEYLLYWTKGQPLSSPLITTGPTSVTGPNGLAGTLNQPGTTILLGGNEIRFNESHGGRLTTGLWVTQSLGLEGSYMVLAEKSVSRSFSAPGTPGSQALSIPFFNVTANNGMGAEDSTAIANPGQFAGAARLDLFTRLQGAELNAVIPGPVNGINIEWLLGFRFLELEEGLNFKTSSPNIDPAMSDIFVTEDNFKTQNKFYGTQVGARSNITEGRLNFITTAKIAFGAMNERIRINGATSTNDFTNFGAVQSFPGAYLALPTNIGDYTRDRFAVIPEINLTVNYAMTRKMSLFAGYTFLFMTECVRPGDQIDRQINPTQSVAFSDRPVNNLTGAAKPQFPAFSTDFYLHGFNFGLEYRF